MTRGLVCTKLFLLSSCPTAKFGENTLSFFPSGQLLGKRSVASQLSYTPVESRSLIPSCVPSLPVRPPPNLNSSHSSDL